MDMNSPIMRPRPREFKDQPLRGPKGTLFIKKHRGWEKVETSLVHRKFGFLVLKMGRALPNGVVLGFYGMPS